MQYVIENEYLTVTADALGAELCAIRGRDGTDYLCRPEKRNWDGSAPILFPNTGWVKDGFALIDGKPYPYRQHGFAKTSLFTPRHLKADRMTFTLGWSDESLALYPWRFELNVTYRLAQNRLWVTAELCNQDSRPLYASLGFHPGFACPLLPAERAEDYALTFPKPVTATRLLLKDAMVAGRAPRFWNGVTEIPITQGLFEGGSLTMTELNVSSLRLASRRSGKAVELCLGDYPNLVLWSPKGKPVTNVCVEPWYGVPDALNGDHQPAAKPNTLCLTPEQLKTLTFTLTFE